MRAIRAGVVGLMVVVTGCAVAPGAAADMPFQQPGQMIFAGNGTNAYVSDYQVVVALSRDPLTGVLTPIESYWGAGRQLVLSPDERFLYASVDSAERGISMYRRDPATGRLDWLPGSPAMVDGLGSITDIALTHDGRFLHAFDSVYGNTRGGEPAHSRILTFARDPDAGGLALVAATEYPEVMVHDLAVSPDDRFLYARDIHGIRRFALDSASGAPGAPGTLDEAGFGGDLLFPADGRHLFNGASGPDVLDRDRESGVLTRRWNASYEEGDISSGWGPAGDQMTFDPQESWLYAFDSDDLRIAQFAIDPDTRDPSHVRSYRNGTEGIWGMEDPQSIAMSPDGRQVYLTAGAMPTQSEPSRIVAFQRDLSTGQLQYAFTWLADKGETHWKNRPPQPPPGPPLSDAFSINGGAKFTASTAVNLLVTIGNPSERTLAAWASNSVGPDGELVQPLRFESAPGRLSWQLASGADGPRLVHVRVDADAHTSRLIGQIVLDTTRPVLGRVRVLARRGSGARAGAVSRVRLRASDATSGVAAMQVTSRTKRPGVWRRYRSTVAAPRRGKRTYVRVRDRAGNVSRWRWVR